MNKNYHLLFQLPGSLQLLVLHNIFQQLPKSENAYELLSNAFDWKESQEGFNFWDKVTDVLEENGGIFPVCEALPAEAALTIPAAFAPHQSQVKRFIDSMHPLNAIHSFQITSIEIGDKVNSGTIGKVDADREINDAAASLIFRIISLYLGLNIKTFIGGPDAKH